VVSGGEVLYDIVGYGVDGLGHSWIEQVWCMIVYPSCVYDMVKKWLERTGRGGKC